MIEYIPLKVNKKETEFKERHPEKQGRDMSSMNRNGAPSIIRPCPGFPGRGG